MSEKGGFVYKWGVGPLAIYVCGIVLPVLIASLRPDLMPAIGVPSYALLFWLGPFASAAVVVWSDWSRGWRIVWVLLVPAFVAITFVTLLV